MIINGNKADILWEKPK